jgi:hypothetical protein
MKSVAVERLGVGAMWLTFLLLYSCANRPHELAFIDSIEQNVDGNGPISWVIFSEMSNVRGAA